ncbi:hypothetical protein RJ640_012391 [Escallonia rubra]|uniref:Uncharacterized protein n=1 Tax=Escallonia rubra TaxID=112253 RepID=A0AA88R4V7_9ASTE|nr:hypothetical protein RJ640_012391 [Escallonia rubra]
MERKGNKSRVMPSEKRYDALADGLQDIIDTAKPSYSSPKGSCNKENINSNQIEVPRLSMEPLQMKRRKKGGGCNLRKSLAWDRAFFTDEGVLDPLELSMITGTFGKSSGEPLSVINEEGRNVFSGDSKPTIKYVDVRAFREISSTEVSDIASSENRDKGGSLVAGHNSSAHDGSTPTSVVDSPVEAYISTNPRPLLLRETRSGIEVNRDVVPSTQLHSSEGREGSTLPVASFTQKTKSVHGNTKSEQMKPSGLRMPSPSLGFFSQPKASGLQSLSDKDTQPCNLADSSILGLRKVGEFRPLHASGKVPKLVNDITPSPSRDVSPSMQCSAFSAPTAVSHKNWPHLEGTSGSAATKFSTENHEFTSDRHDTESSGQVTSPVYNSVLKIRTSSCTESCPVSQKNQPHMERPLVSSGTKFSAENHESSAERHDTENSGQVTYLGQVTHPECDSALKIRTTTIAEVSAISPKNGLHMEGPSGSAQTKSSEENHKFSSDCDDSENSGRVTYPEFDSALKIISTTCANICAVSPTNQPHMEGPSGSARTQFLAESDEISFDRHDTNLEFGSALTMRTTTCAETCSSNEEVLSVEGYQMFARGSCQEELGPKGLERIAKDSESPVGDQCYVLDDDICVEKEKAAALNLGNSSKLSSFGFLFPPSKGNLGFDNGMKQDNHVKRPPPNAIPFSDEWLAAIEAAGEDILTMKSGAVTNSPPDKSQPEPGPWSPVKRKNNQIGPFDCTKCTNILPADSD